ncbi:hypothetical protein PAXINDRAFT_103947 [Paxillus involutus ATCC 200175]|uniref:DNA 3'-5' helicase n=1 Tax=Paxillus involutus ATCC 200175 TaxID=664439 RepID=A0A0C9SLT6_PAXIN|nr:hypothetical protein PAXINDRAFT_103947 [Paxillus involutus ATCC 200175]
MDAASVVIESILNLPLHALDQVAREAINDRLPSDYLETLTGQDKIDALRACLIICFLTSSTIVPRVFQLQASIATLNQHDTIITAGTGSGKTLCLLIPMLLRPRSMSVTILPLKRLQATQVLECQKYGIRTIAINEDTPNDPALWKSIKLGEYQHLIVSPEQLGMYKD